MIRKLVYGVKLLLGKDKPGRNLAIYEDDVFIASYPKSGNTWTRFMVANLIHPDEPVTFQNIERIVPDPDLQSRNFLKKCRRPRVMKSHHPFDPRYKRVIYIVRDPRDVLLSQYHFQIKRGVIQPGYLIEDFVQRSINGETSEYGSWGQNVGSWLVARYGTPAFLLMRYEDFQERPVEELAKVAEFLGVKADGARLKGAVELSSADRMRKLEKIQADQWESTKGTRKDLTFVRRAVAGAWRTDLPIGAVTRIEKAWGHTMRKLAYETTIVSAPDETRLTLPIMELPL